MADDRMTDIQQQVQEAIYRLVESGAERGLQVSVYRHGEPVVDAVAGVADPATSGQPESCLPAGLSKAARRALAAAGYARLGQLTEVSEAEVMKLHGMEPKALDQLRRALSARDQRFAGS